MKNCVKKFFSFSQQDYLSVLATKFLPRCDNDDYDKNDSNDDDDDDDDYDKNNSNNNDGNDNNNDNDGSNLSSRIFITFVWSSVLFKIWRKRKKKGHSHLS